MTKLGVEDLLDATVDRLERSESRPGQVTMAREITSAIESGRHLIVQAGTGTGKSLGYLVPVALSGRRTVVATYTKALQDQLAKFDLPLVASVVEAELGHDLTFAVLKGRSNYLCLQRIDELNDRSQQLDVDPSGTVAVRKLIEWSHETLTGDSGDIDWSLSDNAWRQVSVTSEECPGARKCPRGNDCFAERARALAQESDVIVVNTHLYALDIASDGSILPDHDVVIFDEAHQLEDVVSSSASVAIGPGRVASIASTIRSVIADDALYTRFGRAGTSLTTALAARSGQRVALPLEQSIADALVELRLCTDDALTAVQAISSENESVKQKALRAVTTATRLIEQIDSCLTASASFVAWVSGSADRPLLEIAPLNVAPLLAERVWTKRTAVLTSATIPASLPQRVGIDMGTCDAIDVGSPFDYENSGYIYCAKHLPPPGTDARDDAVNQEIIDLITAAGGRTLALFTTYRAMHLAADAAQERTDFPILRQDDLPKMALVEAFSDDPESCLFATAGFFQGVDVPGDTLSLVIIDKIPFPRPDDPLLSARRDAIGQTAFAEIDIPIAATQL
ncbi:MAG: hypothetical protein RLZZ449_490, partial [Actinomycetota bacterium]